MRIPRTCTAALAAAALTLALAAPAGARTLSGTVVHHNRHAHSFVVAVRGGGLRAVHAAKLPPVGHVVRVRARLLHNHTFAAQHVHVGARHRGHVRLRGVVTFADRHRSRIVLSSNGVSLLVSTHGARGRGHGAHAASDAPATPAPSDAATPAPGTKVDVQADVPSDGTTPVAQTVTSDGKAFSINLEGTILDVDPKNHTVTISADDDSLSGGKITITVPDSIDLAVLSIFAGQEVDLSALLGSDGDGSLSLDGIAGDSDSGAADDPSGMIGSLFGDDSGDGLDF